LSRPAILKCYNALETLVDALYISRTELNVTENKGLCLSGYGIVVSTKVRARAAQVSWG